VALALVLLFGGALLVKSLLRLHRVDPGYHAADVSSVRLTLPWERYDLEAIGGFFRDLCARLEALPGVEAATVGSQIPPLELLRDRFTVEGWEPSDEGTLPSALITAVAPNYFAAMGIPLLGGRAFAETDRADSPRVVVLNSEAAEQFFGTEDPIGQRLKRGEAAAGPWYEVVGVVAPIKNQGLDQPSSPEVFTSIRQQEGANQLHVLVRSELPPGRLVELLRAEVRALDRDQLFYAIQALEQAAALSVAPRRYAAYLLVAFGAFALALAAVGVYSVVSLLVSERAREIGLRMALGASVRQVRRMVVWQSLLPVGVGAAVGLAGALALSRVLGGFLFEVSGADPLTLLCSVLVLLGIAAWASYLPARRASRLDPVSTLRAD
jgi:putative ABC transport system permease protein